MSIKDLVEKAMKLGKSVHNENGEEIPDPRQLEIPLGFGRPRSLQEDIASMMSAAVQQELQAAGAETFEEANNFDTGDHEDYFSPHEDDADPEHTLAREAEMRQGQVKPPDFVDNKQKLDGLYADYQKQKKELKAKIKAEEAEENKK